MPANIRGREITKLNLSYHLFLNKLCRFISQSENKMAIVGRNILESGPREPSGYVAQGRHELDQEGTRDGCGPERVHDDLDNVDDLLGGLIRFCLRNVDPVHRAKDDPCESAASGAVSPRGKGKSDVDAHWCECSSN